MKNPLQTLFNQKPEDQYCERFFVVKNDNQNINVGGMKSITTEIRLFVLVSLITLIV